MKNQKIGGMAAIIEGILYIVGFTVMIAFLAPALDDTATDLERLQFSVDKKNLLQVWNILIYVIFGIVLIPLAIAIKENFNNASILAKSTPILAFIWSGFVIGSGMISNIGLEALSGMIDQDPSAAVLARKTIGIVEDGLGGGVEIIGGLWVFCISLLGIKQSVFPKFLNILGFVVGAAGILTIIPALKDLGALFGLTQIIWFIWIGLCLLKNSKS